VKSLRSLNADQKSSSRGTLSDPKKKGSHLAAREKNGLLVSERGDLSLLKKRIDILTQHVH